jgi:hypothetical protein
MMSANQEPAANEMHPLRMTVERPSRDLIFRRRLPADVGGLSLFVPPDSQLTYFKRGPEAFDAKLLFAAREYPGHAWKGHVEYRREGN